jgi:ribonuclease HII
MDLSGLPLVEIRARLEALRSAAARRRWLLALRGDGRRGAGDLARQLERRAADERAEARRLAGLFARQRRLAASGARLVAGVDEVGVGPLAGPLVAAAVLLPEPEALDLPGLDDSKRLSRAAREELDARIRAQALAVSVAELPAAEVDRLNTYRASLEAMRRAVAALAPAPQHVLVDARTLPGLDAPQTALIGGDASEACIAAASIVAKVYRDARMAELELRFPGYGFARHMGYATREHLAALRRLGPSAIHRRSFTPVSQLDLFGPP